VGCDLVPFFQHPLDECDLGCARDWIAPVVPVQEESCNYAVFFQDVEEPGGEDVRPVVECEGYKSRAYTGRYPRSVGDFAGLCSGECNRAC